MSDFLSDLINNRLRPVSSRGTVDGVLNFTLNDYDVAVDSPAESDTEQEEFVKKEMESYYNDEEHDIDTLSCIDDGGDLTSIGTDLMEYLHVPETFRKYKFDTYSKKQLPIDDFKQRINNLICSNSVIIIQGPTGCGKTTQVPQYIVDYCREHKTPCNVVVTQPRRIAAVNIALRVCEERGWTLGTVCGYQVGLDKGGMTEDIILTYVTTEVLLQRLISQKNLNKYTHIIIDEVHERDKSLDFLLLIVRKYLYTVSPQVKIILMSATLQAEDFANYFKKAVKNNLDQYLPAPILQVDKKSQFITSIYYNEQFSNMNISYNFDEPGISQQQYETCIKLIDIFDSLDKSEKTEMGGVLVFLPGLHEIEEMDKILSARKNFDWNIVPLHSSLRNEFMQKIFESCPPGTRKIILSTNIAESSVTVPDVKYVIDFCLTKVLIVNNVTKFAALTLQWASKTNCTQRAGRVGRVANGRVYRIVPSDFYHNQMVDNTIPELQRAPLENVILYMKMLALVEPPKHILSLAISPPNLKDVGICIWQLKEIGALLRTCRGIETAADGDLTFLGRIMGSLPIDIHLTKLIVLGHMFNCLDDTVVMAAGCMTKNIFVQNFRDRFKCYKKKLLWADGSSSDFVVLKTLYDVWMQTFQKHAFPDFNAQITWCKMNYVNFKGLTDWITLIKELRSRLKKFNIVPPAANLQLKMTPAERATILKVVLCGAFYPNYYIRSPEYGQVDPKEAIKLLNSRDPFNTVYFTNMKTGHPGHIYVRQIKDLLKVDDPSKVQIGFDAQSSKVFVQFMGSQQPEKINLGGRQVLRTTPGSIKPEVYEAVRKRQLAVPFILEVLPDHKAWEFANAKVKKEDPDEEINCFTDIQYSPLPSLDIEYISVIVTHVHDVSYFYCQNHNEETLCLLDSIFAALNGPGVVLDPVTEKIKLHYTYYAAKFNVDNKYYRCKVIDIIPGDKNSAAVVFIDYGNAQTVSSQNIYKLPENRECNVQPIAMGCVLSEVQPHTLLSERGIWSERANKIFKEKTHNVLLNAKVYSVVDDIVHLELFLSNSAAGSPSFNEWLIQEDLGRKMEEDQRSKMDHDIRQKVLHSENPSNVSRLYKYESTSTSYIDFEAPSRSEATETILLKGPFSPLEMSVTGVIEATLGSVVRIDGESVNAVLLDNNPDDCNVQVLVAASVCQSASTKTIRINHTTMMPSLPGLPMLISLLFCPQMEPKLNSDCTRVASILCGMGFKESTNRPHFPEHDLVLVLDTELNENIISQVNELRNTMNKAMKTMDRIYQEIEYPETMHLIMQKLKINLFKLLYMRQKPVDRVNVRYADVWKINARDNLEKMQMTGVTEENDDIWPLLWFFKLDSDKFSDPIRKNLQDMDDIAKRSKPETEINCLLCGSEIFRTINQVRIHLFKNEHQKNLEQLAPQEI